MLKLNNKGFAISGILYATLILFLILMLGTLSILASGKFLLDKTKNELVNKLNNEEYIEIVFDYLEMRVALNYPGTINFLDGVRAYDKNGEELPSSNISYETNMDITKGGTYKVSYIATTGKWSIKAIRSIVVEVEYADTILNGADPELSDGMIPVRWNGTSWVKADTFQKWYDYSSQEWANVVLVTEETRNTYKSASTGTIIDEIDVLAYLVWIPRYRYKLFNVGALATSPQTIEIAFEDKNTTKSNGITNGTWLTHPAFTFGSSEVNGIWVGKFETTGNATTPTIKPNVTSLRNQNVRNQFETAQKFNNIATYGTTSDYDSHMMKSMEWGAVTYLSHSIYGKNSEIFINPSSGYITGRGGNAVSQSSTTDSSGSSSATLYSYDGKQCNTKTGYVCTGATHATYGMASSTTGNIYGIYDMSGGSWEYVMGAMYNSGNTTVMISSSGFAKATIDSAGMSKYINKYTYGTTYNNQTAYNRRQLGDATGETRGWYSNYAGFVGSSFPWSLRGGYYSGTAYAGAFCFGSDKGAAGSDYSFRVVQLKP